MKRVKDEIKPFLKAGLVKPPPEDLVIYEIEGACDEDLNQILGRDYLGLWVEGGYTFLFFSKESGPKTDQLISARKNLTLRRIHKMKYRQWQDGASFEPFSVGSLTISPAWRADLPASPDDGRLLIDPGLAFGFGGHPTTKACLNMLSRIFREDSPLNMLDLGAGTGILSLAALRYGAEKATAIEYSRLGAEAAKKNAVINGLEDRIRIIKGLAEDHALISADLVAANLHFEALNSIVDLGGFNNRRRLIVSGLFHAEADILEARLVDVGLRRLDIIRDERWATMLFAPQ